MAEETINQADNLDAQKSSFDQLLSQSDFLNPATIEQPLAPKLNWQDNFANPTNYIKDNSAGVSPDFPPSAVRSSRENGASVGGFGAMLDQGMNKINNMTDLGNYATPYAYDASPKGTFRARYKAYGQDTFNKIGFHPLIDNETLFNQNTTFGDDLSRWASHAAWPMITKGFMDPIRSYKSIMDGNGLFDADAQSARDYEYYNALGASSKGGLGGFTVNLFNSAAYSMGILMEGAVEGALIGSLFGGGNPATGAVEGGATFLNRLGKLPKALVETTQATSKLLSSVKNYSNLSKAKELYVSAGKNFGNFFNPLTNTYEAYKQLKNTDNLTNLARTATTAGALWHDMMAMNLALSEGKLEGGFTRYQTYDKLYNDFYAKTGKTPTLEQQESMMRQASEGAFKNTLANTALIFYSNKLVFPSITNASFLKGVPKFGFGKVVTNVGKDFQIVFEPGKKALEGAFSKQRINLVNAVKSLAKPATYGKVGLNYFKANVVEGGQEILQDVLQDATQKYYTETFYNPDARNYRYAAGILGDALSKQWSKQGLETFLSGFLMGSILQAPGFMKKYATIGFNDYLKKDGSYEQYIKDREKLADDVVNEMNTMYKNGQYFFDPRINNYANQALAAKVVDNPDEHTTKEIKDTEFTAFQSAVLSSLQTGTFDLFLNHYEGYRQASAEDIEQAWNLKPGEGEKALERFESAIDNAKKISKRWNSAKEKMKFMANLDDYEKDSDEYRMAEIYNKAYNQSLYNYVFLHESFDDNVKRQKKLYERLSSLSPIKESTFGDIATLTDPNRLTSQIEMMKVEIENLESFGTAESMAEASRKREMLELFNRFDERQQALVELFANKGLLENFKADILNEDPTLSEEEVTVQTIDRIIQQFENGESNEFFDYKDAFNELLMGLAGSPEKRMMLEQEMENLGGIDVLFDDLLDTHIIRNENARLNQYVNLLSNPRDFYEHLMRNFKFMKDLYNNREEVIRDIVNKEIAAIENNTLLNTLADKGIYIDLEEFAKWVENPRVLPEYFIDVTNNRMINKGSVLYDQYVDILYKAATLQEKKPAGDPLTQKQLLDKRIENLENDRSDALQKEKDKYDEKFRARYGFTQEEYERQESERIASEEITDEEREALQQEKDILTKAVDKLNSDNYVEVQAAAEVVAEEVFTKRNESGEEFFNEQTEMLKNDREQNRMVFEMSQKYDTSDIDGTQEQFNAKIDSALKAIIYGKAAASRLDQIEIELNKQPATPTIDVVNTVEYIAYQEAVAAINDKYDALIQEVKDEFREKGVDENTPDNYTTKTDFEDFDPEFQSEITDQFDAYLVDVLGESIDLKTKNPDEYERLRSNWLERQTQLVEGFNERAKEKSLEKARRLAEPPQLKFISTVINAQTPTYTISSIIKRFQKFLEDGQYPDPKNAKNKIQLTPEDVQNIKDDIEGLNGYLNARVTAAAPRNIAEQTIEIIQENVINKQEELVDVTDADGNVIGRTFRDRGPNEPMPDRSTQVAEEVETSLLGKEPFEYNPIKETVDAEGNAVASPLENLYNQFFNDPDIVPEDRVRLFMEEFKRKSYQDKGGWKQFRSEKKLKAIEDSITTNGTYEHLRNTVKRNAFRESSDAGDVVDTLIRIFLTPNAVNKSNFNEFNYDSEIEIKGRPVKISDTMSRKVFDRLFAPVTTTSPGGIVTKFRLGIVDGSYMILSENVKLFDRRLRDGKGVTGELDLLLVREDGSVAIVDIKTGGKDKWADFGSLSKKDKQTYFRAQQSIYGYMFYNNTGITPDLKLMPFEIDVNLDGYIEDIKLASIVEAGNDTVDLEYLPEIENFGIDKIKPDIKAPIKKVEVAEEKKEGIPESDPVENRLQQNLNKPVLLGRRVGKLVKMPDGGFGVEVVVNNNITGLQLTLDALEANLLVEKQYGTEETIAELESNIKRIAAAIESAEGLTEVLPVQKDGTTVINGELTLNDVGLQLVIPIENPGQLSSVKGEVVNASFSNKEESIASINGVKYDVLRDDSGNITALSYMSNDQEISKVDKEIGATSEKIGKLRNSLSTETGSVENQDSILNRIAELQARMRQLNSRRKSLYDNNKKMYLYGENANNYIFALNRLPNGFQRLTKNATTANEAQDLKSIDNLSLSSSVAASITEILSEQYPDALDRLLDGDTKSLNSRDLLNIQLWIEDSIAKLNQLGFSVINRGDIVDDITNQINALNELSSNLELIKLTKDGKIYNYKQVGEFFGEERVPQGTSVPQNERTTRRPAERVPGPATREELQDLVKRAREESVDDVFEEPAPGLVPTTSISKINAATLSTIESAYEAAYLDAVKNGEDPTGLREAYTKRLQELKTILAIPNVEKGEYLISKNPIFTDISGEIVEVVKVGNNTVTLKNIKTDQSREFSEEELVNNFEKTTMEATQPEAPVELTPVDIEDSNESKNTIKEIQNDDVALAKAKEQSKSSDRNSRLNKLADNSKLC